MSSSDTPKAPAGLGSRGRRFWRRVTEEVEFTDSETVILEETCRVLDRLELLNGDIAERGVTVPGSAGQTVLNPSLQEARQQEVVLHRLLAALAIPTEDGATLATARNAASIAANNARWGRTMKAV